MYKMCKYFYILHFVTVYYWFSICFVRMHFVRGIFGGGVEVGNFHITVLHAIMHGLFRTVKSKVYIPWMHSLSAHIEARYHLCMTWCNKCWVSHSTWCFFFSYQKKLRQLQLWVLAILQCYDDQFLSIDGGTCTCWVDCKEQIVDFRYGWHIDKQIKSIFFKCFSMRNWFWFVSLCWTSVNAPLVSASNHTKNLQYRKPGWLWTSTKNSIVYLIISYHLSFSKIFSYDLLSNISIL